MSIGTIQKSVYNNLFTRTFGGTQDPAVADPYISGFGFLWFDKLPDKLQTYSGIDTKSMQKTLAALCVRTTMPTVTMNKTTINGLGGKKWSAPTSLNVGETATLTFTELSGTPVKLIIGNWVNMIRDIRTGVAQIKGPEYSKEKYSGSAYYITTKPDGKTIETAMYMTGMFPEKNPFDSFNLDIATNEKVEMDIEFNVDNIWDGTKDGPETGQRFVLDQAQTIIETVAEAKETFINWSGQ